MKSTNSNLLNLVYRLIASGIILFICTEVVLAYVFAFYLIPSKKEQKFGKEMDCLRLGIELGDKSGLLSNSDHALLCSFTELTHTYESYVSLKYNLLDAVKTDQLTARILMENHEAVPFAFLMDVETKKPYRERMLLVTKDKEVDFFEQTKGLSIVISSNPLGIEKIIFSEFLNKRTGGMHEWFSSISLTLNDFSALGKVLKGTCNIAAVSENSYKAYLDKIGKDAESLRVLWYSNPLSRNVIMVKKGLSENQMLQLKNIIKKEDSEIFNWFLFDESLEELQKWKFTIRGKQFDYSNRHFNAGIKL